MSLLQIIKDLFNGQPTPTPPPPRPVPAPLPSRDEEKVMICPFCRTDLKSKVVDPEPEKCGDCKHVIPLEYRTGHYVAPAVCMPVIGRSGHGKSFYLSALASMLENSYLFWEGARVEAHSKATEEWLETIRKAILSKVALPRTKPTIQDAYIMRLHNLGHTWGSLTFVLRDFAGELFQEHEIREEHRLYLRGRDKDPVVFMISLTPKEAEPGPKFYRNDELVDRYARTLHRMPQGIELSPKSRLRRGIVVLSMADAIPDLPPNLRRYLHDDPLGRIVNEGKLSYVRSDGDQGMTAYIERMREMSQEVARWLATAPKAYPEGPKLLSALQSRGMEIQHGTLDFCLVSLGADPAENQPKPLRILDPFFFVLLAGRASDR